MIKCNPTKVYILELAHTGTCAQLPSTVMVYGNHAGLLSGLRRLFAVTKKHVQQQLKFEQELCTIEAEDPWNCSGKNSKSYVEWCRNFRQQVDDRCAAGAVEALNDMPVQFKLYNFRLLEERVIY